MKLLMFDAKHLDEFGGCWVTPEGAVYNANGKRLKSHKNKKGYHCITVNKHHGLLLSRVVCFAFHENPDNLPQVNHIDSDKDNNCAANLEWCDCAYNMRHRWLTRKRQGLPWLTITDKVCERLERTRKRVRYCGIEYESICDMARKFGKRKDYIREIVKRGHWHGRKVEIISQNGGGMARIPRPEGRRAHRARCKNNIA